MKPEKRPRRWLLWITVCAFIAQGVATGARLAELSDPVSALAQGAAVVLVLVAIGLAALMLTNSKYLRKYSALVAESTRPVWLASRVPATVKSLAEVTADFGGDVSRLFAVSFESESLQIVDLPSGERRVEFEFTSIVDVQVARTLYFGGGSDCLVISVEGAAEAVEIPIVLFRDTAPGYLVQDADQLREAARDLVGCMSRG
ncbi:hypothetical protein ASE14_18830 [Agromyces sp. Root81]|uniref:hypothetical protein n=1 Tax=Agromyces sp. Root81 TaxID=1736601 RepID=UPI0006FF9549|nr:hypothetical protein [Agromyces sp. Root81]KRC58611.1 hypothetical protein ASE14_18830 [Agromyces sp. Root81]